MERKNVKVAYGFCVIKSTVCPLLEGADACKLGAGYENCPSFRKVGSQSAIEEIDDDGQRRIYLATAQGVYKEIGSEGTVSHSASGQTFFSSRVS